MTPPPASPRLAQVQRIGDLDVQLQGQGPEVLLMLHGWPDTLAVWDDTVAALAPHARCVRFTLPGFEPGAAPRAASLADITERLRQVAEATGGGQPVTLLLHDWGCLFGYHFAHAHPSLVRRVIAVDIGDANSRAHRAELGLGAKLAVAGYQLWLALAWALARAGLRRLGDAMARWMARRFRAPAPQAVHAGMGWPYAVAWWGVAGGLGAARRFDPNPERPLLFFHGQRKPFMFHSRAWRDRVAATPGCQAVALPTGHWVMKQAPQAFQQAILAWMGWTKPPR